jgi:hypothetical protein
VAIHIVSLVSLATPAVVFAGRHFILAVISKGVQHGFDVKIENVRIELRNNEERFKSELRDKESEIARLRNSVLSGNASRQSMLDKRRFEAVEKIWTATNPQPFSRRLRSSFLRRAPGEALLLLLKGLRRSRLSVAGSRARSRRDHNR